MDIINRGVLLIFIWLYAVLLKTTRIIIFSDKIVIFIVFKQMGKFFFIVLFCSFGVVFKTTGTCFNKENQQSCFIEPVRRQAVKTTFLSWFTGSCKLSYEHTVFKNQTIELTAGYIGLGKDKFNNSPKGFTTRYAHKYIFYGNHIQPLNGFYFRPEMIFSYFRYESEYVLERTLSKMGDIVLTVGYQYAMHRFVADIFFGGGYAFGKEADTHYQHGFMLWDFFGAYKKHIGMTFGVKFGVSF